MIDQDDRLMQIASRITAQVDVPRDATVTDMLELLVTKIEEMKKHGKGLALEHVRLTQQVQQQRRVLASIFDSLRGLYSDDC